MYLPKLDLHRVVERFSSMLSCDSEQTVNELWLNVVHS